MKLETIVEVFEKMFVLDGYFNFARDLIPNFLEFFEDSLKKGLKKEKIIKYYGHIKNLKGLEFKEDWIRGDGHLV